MDQREGPIDLHEDLIARYGQANIVTYGFVPLRGKVLVLLEDTHAVFSGLARIIGDLRDYATVRTYTVPEGGPASVIPADITAKLPKEYIVMEWQLRTESDRAVESIDRSISFNERLRAAGIRLANQFGWAMLR